MILIPASTLPLKHCMSHLFLCAAMVWSMQPLLAASLFKTDLLQHQLIEEAETTLADRGYFIHWHEAYEQRHHNKKLHIINAILQVLESTGSFTTKRVFFADDHFVLQHPTQEYQVAFSLNTHPPEPHTSTAPLLARTPSHILREYDDAIKDIPETIDDIDIELPETEIKVSPPDVIPPRIQKYIDRIDLMPLPQILQQDQDDDSTPQSSSSSIKKRKKSNPSHSSPSAGNKPSSQKPSKQPKKSTISDPPLTPNTPFDGSDNLGSESPPLPAPPKTQDTDSTAGNDLNATATQPPKTNPTNESPPQQPVLSLQPWMVMAATVTFRALFPPGFVLWVSSGITGYASLYVHDTIYIYRTIHELEQAITVKNNPNLTAEEKERRIRNHQELAHQMNDMLVVRHKSSKKAIEDLKVDELRPQDDEDINDQNSPDPSS